MSKVCVSGVVLGVLVATSLTFNTTGFSILSFNPAPAFRAFPKCLPHRRQPEDCPALLPDLVAFESTSLAAESVVVNTFTGAFVNTCRRYRSHRLLTVKDFTTTTLLVDEVVP